MTFTLPNFILPYIFSAFSDTLDFSNMTLHSLKRMHMECQVKVLELESDLEKERRRLAELRKQHYQKGGESEGWEQEVGR